jgi:hypothetical protein
MATPVPAATPAPASALAAHRPMPLQVPGAQQQPGCMMDAVTPLGPAARAAREQNDAEARVERWDAAARLLAEDSNETLVRHGSSLL